MSQIHTLEKININCPYCNQNIQIILDESFNVISVKHNCKNKIGDIEFGTLKEGENIN
jgi:hypothetical protein